MENNHIALTILCIIAVALLLFFAICHSFNVFTWASSWIFSNKEETAGLTRIKGHYNANGYLIHSDSDIHLDATGSFKRFDCVDTDFKITLATTSLTEWNNVEDDRAIPPQPLRPAPLSPPLPKASPPAPPPTPQHKQSSREDSLEGTSISPIPRPVSSLNMAAVLASQSSFPVTITPPPSPLTPALGAAAVQTSKFNSFPQTSSAQIFHQQHPLQPQQSQEAAGQSTSNDETDLVMSSALLRRALSCDSVCSDTSVGVCDLEEGNVTGYLCIGLEYDSETFELIVNVLEAKDLLGSSRPHSLIDSYVRIFLLPDKITIQTKTCRGSSSPSYKERFLFYMNPREQSQKALCFQVYGTDFMSHLMIGEGEIRLGDVTLRQPVTTWVTLTDTGQRGTEFGELMFSLSYLPTAERLTVVVVKARNLKFSNETTPGDVYVKVYLLQHGKKIHKKKTSTKKAERCPIFNEAMMFSVPAHSLSTIHLRLTVSEPIPGDDPKAYPIGHVIVGSQASGRSLSHWNQMLTALRKPVAMWHSLRK